jgi:hypothetical protein
LGIADEIKAGHGFTKPDTNHSYGIRHSGPPDGMGGEDAGKVMTQLKTGKGKTPEKMRHGLGWGRNMHKLLEASPVNQSAWDRCKNRLIRCSADFTELLNFVHISLLLIRKDNPSM